MQNPSQIFADSLVCVACERPVMYKGRALKIRKHGDKLCYRYRCARCFTLYRGLVSRVMLAKIKERGLNPKQCKDAKLQAPAPDLPKPRPATSESGEAMLAHFISRKRKEHGEKRAMKKFSRRFFKSLAAQEDLARVVMSEGGWKNK